MPSSPSYQRNSAQTRKSAAHVLILLGLWLAIFAGALFSPPLLDDADATHAQAARSMATTGDWVTLHVNGIRYLEKPPLPYWLVAISFRIFGFNTFAVHLPLALAVLALATLGYIWSSKAFDDRTAFYTALATLTCTGIFLFTRIFIPEVLLSLFLCIALYSFLQTLEPTTNLSSRPKRSDVERSPRWSPPSTTTNLSSRPERSVVERPAALHPYILWTALAFAVLTKGLIALVFFFGTAAIYLSLTGEWKNWRRLRPFTGLALFLAIAAPWHILAGLRNTEGANGHGFFWFYFINEHVLRFLGRRIPHDYNKLPGYLYWSLHLIWLFPWSLFAPAALIIGWRQWRLRRNAYRHAVKMGKEEDGPGPPYNWSFGIRWQSFRFIRAIRYTTNTLAGRTVLLLTIYSTLILLFFALSTNQEYYTFPVYLPLLMFICAALTQAESLSDTDRTLRRAILAAHIAYTAIGLAAAAALAYGLWSARNYAFVPDIGSLLAHRGVGDYTLSMSHFFDLTGPSFAALRLPATIALIAFAFGPAIALFLRRKQKHFASTITVAVTNAIFLIAAHIALGRFAPMLSSKPFADKIQQLSAAQSIDPDTDILLFGDQAFGSSVPFYLDRQVKLVDGRTTSMLFGSTFPDAPNIFLTSQQLAAQWGHGPRKILFVPEENRAEVDRLLGPNQIVLNETSGKLLITDHPLNGGSR